MAYIRLINKPTFTKVTQAVNAKMQLKVSENNEDNRASIMK